MNNRDEYNFPRQQVDLLDQIFNPFSDSVFISNEQGRILYVNDAACRNLGYLRNKLLGLTVQDIESDITAEKYSVIWEKVLADGSAIFESRHRRSDGSCYAVEIRRSVYVNKGRILNLQLVQNIASRKLIEISRINDQENMRQIIENHTATMAQMSHELRTPLNAILGFSQLLQIDASLSVKQIEQLSIIEKSGDHLMSLINQLLDFAKIEADKLELNIGDIQLDVFIQTVIGIISVQADKKKLAFIHEIDQGLPSVIRGDEVRLCQVLLNLLANAVKFTDHGQVSLKVSKTETDRIRFEVRDSGIGIAESHWETIFQPFEQVTDVKHTKNGTGLGLAISHKLVQLMGGNIELQSRPGKGSLFAFDMALDVLQSGHEVQPPKEIC